MGGACGGRVRAQEDSGPQGTRPGLGVGTPVLAGVRGGQPRWEVR